MFKLTRVLIALFLLALVGQVTADENLKKGLAKAQYMLRQANVEKVAVQKQLDEEKRKAEEAQKELEEKQSGLAKANGRINKLKATIDVWQEEYEVLKDKLRTTQLELAKMKQYSAFQQERSGIQQSNFELCETHNASLVKISKELLDAYQNKGVTDALKQDDPFFGLKQVEIENLVQEYQFRIEDLSLKFNEYLVQQVPSLAREELN